MIQIRQGVFETNSSSTHSICICTQDEFNKFKNGEMVYNNWDEELVTEEEFEKMCKSNDYIVDYKDKKNFDDFFYKGYLETYIEKFTSPSGDEMVAFGEYGHD